MKTLLTTLITENFPEYSFKYTRKSEANIWLRDAALPAIVCYEYNSGQLIGKFANPLYLFYIQFLNITNEIEEDTSTNDVIYSRTLEDVRKLAILLNDSDTLTVSGNLSFNKILPTKYDTILIGTELIVEFAAKSLNKFCY